MTKKMREEIRKSDPKKMMCKAVIICSAFTGPQMSDSFFVLL